MHQLAHNFQELQENERVAVLASVIEQYAGATEDLMMAYWVLRVLKEKQQLSVLDAYLAIDIKEQKNSDFSTRRMLNHLKRATRKSFINKLGLPQPERIRLLNTHLEAAELFEANTSKELSYLKWVDTTILFLKAIGRDRLKDRPQGGSLVNVYNKIKHGSLFFYNKPRNEIVFPIAKGKRPNWYKITFIEISGTMIDSIGKKMEQINSCISDLYFFYLLNKDPNKAIAAKQLARDWTFTGGPVQL